MEFSGGEIIKRTFFNHVFSTTDEGKAELLNAVQYSFLAIIPVLFLNKAIQKIIPDADIDNTSVSIVFEILAQIAILFIGIILIHRSITYFPTYSGFRYESLTVTNVIVAILLILLSIQTKLGLKVNIMYERLIDLWEGTSYASGDESKKGVRVKQPASRHAPSQADFVDNSGTQHDLFPPAPIPSSGPANVPTQQNDYGPLPANVALGGSFGSMF